MSLCYKVVQLTYGQKLQNKYKTWKLQNWENNCGHFLPTSILSAKWGNYQLTKFSTIIYVNVNFEKKQHFTNVFIHYFGRIYLFICMLLQK